jgi:hypothetical protein
MAWIAMSPRATITMGARIDPLTSFFFRLPHTSPGKSDEGSHMDAA